MSPDPPIWTAPLVPAAFATASLVELMIVPVGGRKRSALLGIRMMFVRWATMRETFAVMPGRSFRSRLSTATTVV